MGLVYVNQMNNVRQQTDQLKKYSFNLIMIDGNRFYESEHYGMALKQYLKCLSIYVYLDRIGTEYKEKQVDNHYLTKVNGYLNVAKCFSKLNLHE